MNSTDRPLTHKCGCAGCPNTATDRMDDDGKTRFVEMFCSNECGQRVIYGGGTTSRASGGGYWTGD